MTLQQTFSTKLKAETDSEAGVIETKYRTGGGG